MATIAIYSNVLTFSMSKRRIRITPKLAPTVIFLNQCHSSEMPLITGHRSVTAAIGSCSLSWHVLSVIRLLRYCIRHIAELWAD